VLRDVAIVGGGPAGYALAHSLTKRGIDVVLFAPDESWHATYGAWRDDVEACELGAPLDSLLRGAWPTVRVVGTREHLLARPYVVFDNDRLRSAMCEIVHVTTQKAVAIKHGLDYSTVTLAGGESINARLVVDATGRGMFLARRGSASGGQTAYGIVMRGSSDVAGRTALRPDQFTLMDWSSPPTFLYAAQFADGSCLVEETSLFAEPPHGLDELRRRLAGRLGEDFTPRAIAVENVNIPMGVPLPLRTTRVVGFGAAAGFIHPVTGYSVAASLRAAPRVAESIRTALRAGGSGSELASVVWSSVWPAQQVRTRAWHDIGLSVLRSLPGATIPKFFDAFFDLPSELSAAYLRIDSSPSEVRAAMLGVFRGVDASTRVRLMASPGGLLRALVAR